MARKVCDQEMLKRCPACLCDSVTDHLWKVENYIFIMIISKNWLGCQVWFDASYQIAQHPDRMMCKDKKRTRNNFHDKNPKTCWNWATTTHQLKRVHVCTNYLSVSAAGTPVSLSATQVSPSTTPVSPAGPPLSPTRDSCSYISFSCSYNSVSCCYTGVSFYYTSVCFCFTSVSCRFTLVSFQYISVCYPYVNVSRCYTSVSCS